MNAIPLHAIPLHAIDPSEPTTLALVGGKAAGLAHLITAGMPVPPGFVVPTTAYRQIVRDQDLDATIRAAVADDNPTDTIATAFARAALPPALESAIRLEYAALSRDGQPVAVAVRSSATAEDLASASFAGQQDTYLGIVGAEAVIDAVRRCWASLWNEHAVAYRHRADSTLSLDDLAIAVVVQVLVDADAAGVMFTADPVNGARDHIVVNATWGLGEALVGGEVTPDLVVLDARTGAALRTEIADKHVMTHRTTTGSTLAPVPEDRRRTPVLTDHDLAALLHLGLAIQEHSGRPMDIEWAREGQTFWILQARPITALPPDLLGMEWSREMLIERYPEPLTPLTWSAVDESFFRSLATSVRSLGGTLPTDVPLVTLIHGRAYINVTAFQRGMSTLPLRPPVARQAEADDAPTSDAKPAATPAGKPAANPRALASGLLALIRLVLGTHRDWEARLPAYIAATNDSERTDWAALTPAQLLELKQARKSLLEPMLDNHARAIVAGDLTLQMLRGLTTRWLGDTDGAAVLTLLAGLEDNRTVETNHDLWRLAEHVRSHPGLRRLVEQDATDPQTLGAVAGGPEFTRDLGRFLDRYGHRSPRYEFRHPTWREDPSQVLALLRLMLDGAPDPQVGQAAAAKARTDLTADLRSRLAWPKRLVFDRVLRLAQTYFRLRENQQFYLVMGNPGLRAMVATIGARLTAHGLVDCPDDAYFLTHAEQDDLLRALAEDGPVVVTARDAGRTRTLVADRRDQLARDAATAAPMHLTGRAAPSTTDGTNGTNGTNGTDGSDVDGTLHGIPASAGTATGPARIVRAPEDFGSVCRGDILVAPATTPAWTPLFGVAGGLVTEYGGLLSHSGVVAREYGLPAVLGVAGVLDRVGDGDLLTVDGATGRVTIAAPVASPVS
ncbi:MAG: PEP/pyruvate-binding domain-containing protein [Dermatophilaceae bacterium]